MFGVGCWRSSSIRGSLRHRLPRRHKHRIRDCRAFRHVIAESRVMTHIYTTSDWPASIPEQSGHLWSHQGAAAQNQVLRPLRWRLPPTARRLPDLVLPNRQSLDCFLEGSIPHHLRPSQGQGTDIRLEENFQCEPRNQCLQLLAVESE